MRRKKYRHGGAVKGYADGGKVVHTEDFMNDKPTFLGAVKDRIKELTPKFGKPKVEGLAAQDRMYINKKRQKQLDET